MSTPTPTPRRRLLDWNLVTWVKIALLSSLSTVLMLALQIPLFPSFPFLTYDLSEIPALVAGFALGPLQGIAVVCVKNLLFLVQRPQFAELVGVPMNIVAGSALVGSSAWFYWRRKTRVRAMLALALGAVVMTLVMIPANALVWPFFSWLILGQAGEGSLEFVLRVVTPFNFLKGALSGVLTFLVYKRFSGFLKRW